LTPESCRSRLSALGQTRLKSRPDCALVYRWIDSIVYRKPISRCAAPIYHTAFTREVSLSADYHQQYLAKNPNGYCGIGGCGVAYGPNEFAAIR
jgi:hypothetical protein